MSSVLKSVRIRQARALAAKRIHAKKMSEYERRCALAQDEKRWLAVRIREIRNLPEKLYRKERSKLVKHSRWRLRYGIRAGIFFDKHGRPWIKK